MSVIPLGPAEVDLIGIRAGDRNEVTCAVHNDGIPIDLTGVPIAAQARVKATDAQPAITAVITVTDAPTGQFAMRWPGDQVTNLLAGASSWKGVWDLQIGEEPDGHTIAAGKFTCDMDVTR